MSRIKIQKLRFRRIFAKRLLQKLCFFLFLRVPFFLNLLDLEVSQHCINQIHTLIDKPVDGLHGTSESLDGGRRRGGGGGGLAPFRLLLLRDFFVFFFFVVLFYGYVTRYEVQRFHLICNGRRSRIQIKISHLLEFFFGRWMWLLM